MAQDGISEVQSPVCDVGFPSMLTLPAIFEEKAALWSSCCFLWDCAEKSPCAFPHNIQAFICKAL